MADSGWKSKEEKYERELEAAKNRLKEFRKREREKEAELFEKRSLVVGKHILKVIEHGHEFTREIENILNHAITKKSERKLLGLDVINLPES